MKIDGILYSGHRLAWLYMTGGMPNSEIDHINRIRPDNRYSNLREATPSENKANTNIHSRNTSGIRGVSYCESRGKFLAQISCNGKNMNLGRYINLSDAISAYKTAQAKFHGKFAPNYES